jgi:hypothetical protein
MSPLMCLEILNSNQIYLKLHCFVCKLVALNYRRMVERYPNLKEKVDSWNHGCEISLFLTENYQVVHCLLCFGASVSTFCLNK